MKYKSAKKPAKCPACGSEKIARILYGLPVFSLSLEKEIEDHKTILGGCCVIREDPVWKCIDYKRTGKIAGVMHATPLLIYLGIMYSV